MRAPLLVDWKHGPELVEVDDPVPSHACEPTRSTDLHVRAVVVAS